MLVLELDCRHSRVIIDVLLVVTVNDKLSFVLDGVAGLQTVADTVGVKQMIVFIKVVIFD
jgi:hypothetical protein